MNPLDLVNLNSISKFCFGCEPLGGTDWGKIDVRKIEDAIEKSLELGINFFDTADVYGLGLSESRLSDILGHKRHDLFIATKGGVSWSQNNKQKRADVVIDCSPKYLSQAVENSLKRLKLEILPIYFVHWPDDKVEFKETFNLLSELQLQEKIGLIGCSNFSDSQLLLASKYANISLVQLPINPLDSPLSKSTQKICSANNIKIIAYNVLASGLLTGKFKSSTSFPNNDRRSRLENFKKENFDMVYKKIKQLEVEASELNLTILEYTIKWVLQKDNVLSVINGIKNKQQAENNINSLLKVTKLENE